LRQYKAGPKLKILLPQPPRCCYHRCAPPHPTSLLVLTDVP
jgi:hypothetical protein